MKTRLQVILSHSGIASRRKSAELIETGKVRVNGKVILEKGFRVNPDTDDVEVDGRHLAFEKKVYYMINKPKGVITSASDEKGRLTVLDLVAGKVRGRVYPVGRLDKETEGLLILTNDGGLSYRLTHPKFGVEKKYIVSVKPRLSPADIKRLEKGVYIDGKRTSRCAFSVLDKAPNRMTLEVVIHEGRKRQIRRMIEYAGGRVDKLKRVEYAGIKMKSLNKGEFRPLSKYEIARLKEDN